jgi:heavy metal sensor kinase
MIRRIPIRWRLSLWYTALTALVLALFSFAIYQGLETQLADQLDEDLRSQAALAAASVTFGSGNAILEAAYRDQLSEEALLWVIAPDGVVLLSIRGSELEEAPPEMDHLGRALDGKTTLETVAGNGESLRVITVPIRARDQFGSTNRVISALQLAYSRDRITDTVELLLTALLVVAPVGIAISALTGYWLAGRALRPVADITHLASQIDGDDLGSRLNLDLPDDELGRLASTFDSMLVRIDEAFQRQRQFTGDAAHELRTPLALMRSQIDLAMTQAESTSEYREALAALDGDVTRMTALVGMLLSLARADAGQLTPNREPVDLADLARDVTEQLEPIAAETGITLQANLEPVTATVDADMIIQVLVNLIDNAIKHTPIGGTVTVGVARANAAATITVSDTGAGIPAVHLPRIFDRFYRVETGRARSAGGSGGIGLGLAICQAIAHAHQGTLTASSEEGKGSTFRLTIPTDAAGVR